MFASDKAKKPLGNMLRDTTGRSKLPEELHHGIDSNKGKPNLLQTKLCMRRSFKPISSNNFNSKNKDETSASNSLIPTTELFIMPMPKEKYVTNPNKKLKTFADNTDSEASTSSQQQRRAQLSNDDKLSSIDVLMPRPEHQLRALTGQIDYALQIQKQYPQLDALWNLYSKLIKISRGKQRFEYILLLRNLNNQGPIMRCIYYDFNNNLQQFAPYCDVRAVGRWMVTSNFRIFKLLPLAETIKDEDLISIQNVTTYVLQNAKSIYDNLKI